MFSLNELMQAFDNNLLYAWEILYADILMEAAPLSADRLRSLVLLYSKGLEKSTHLQNSQENYFKLKIDHLMGQRKVIQCLHEDKMDKRKKDNPAAEDNRAVGQADSTDREGMQRTGKQMGKAKAAVKLNPSLQARKPYDIEQSRTSKLSKMLKQQSLREEKLQGIVLKCINSEQQKLKRKIQQRKQRASTTRMAASLKLETSAISTCTFADAIDSYDNLDAILDQIPFLNSTDADL